MQLAVEDRVFLVDMLHVCRSKGEAAAVTAAAVAVENDDPTGLTETEALLEDALAAVLRAPRVVKVGVGPKVCVCVCVFIKLHITTQSGPVILVILCHSH